MSRLIGTIDSTALIKALKADPNHLFNELIPKLSHDHVDFISETDCNIYTLQVFLSDIMKYHEEEKVDEKLNLAIINSNTYLGLHLVQGYHVHKNCINHNPTEEEFIEYGDILKKSKRIEYAHKLEESCQVKEWEDLTPFETFYNLEKGPQPSYDELKMMNITANSKNGKAKLGLILEIGRLGKANEIGLKCLIDKDEGKDVRDVLSKNNVSIEIYDHNHDDEDDDEICDILNDIIEKSEETISDEDLKLDQQCWEHHTSGFFTRWLFPYFKKMTLKGIINRIKLLHPTKEKPFECILFGDWEWYEHSIIREFSELLEHECKNTKNINKVLHQYSLASNGQWNGSPMFAKFHLEIYESETEGKVLNQKYPVD